MSDKLTAFTALAHDRFSCRAFLPDPVPQAAIDQMLALAQRAPSDCNTQGWFTYVISGAPLEALRAEMLAHAESGGAVDCDIAPVEKYQGAMLDRRRACGWGLYEAVGIAKGDRVASAAQTMQNFRFFGAPHLAVVTADASMGERGLVDAGIYMGYLLLAAEALDLGVVPQAAIAHYASLLRKHLSISPEHRIIAGVAFGIKDPDHPANAFRTARADVAEVTRTIPAR